MLPPRSKRELFERVRTLWPKELHIPTAQPWLPAVSTEPAGFAIYEVIADSLPATDEWANLAAWAFHQALGELVERRYKSAERIVVVSDVSFGSFDTQMKSNLAHTSWDAERPIYLALPPT